jgi:hypothetical protein
MRNQATATKQPQPCQGCAIDERPGTQRSLRQRWAVGRDRFAVSEIQLRYFDGPSRSHVDRLVRCKSRRR